jgi:cobalt-zinc-cadmium resistance protein CzcA
MIQRLIQFSVHNPLLVFIGTFGLVIWGAFSLRNLPLDAIPDVTNNQVVVATQSPNLSAVEMEQFVTYPIEIAMRNIQGLEGIRSVSQFGLSIVTLDFKESVDLYFARNQVNERLQMVQQDIPEGFGHPTMNPITTGLGEIYQYVIKPKNPADTSWSAMELRTVQDWVVKKQLLGTEGVADISSFGGYLKQYHVKVDPALLQATGTTLADVFQAIEKGSQNTGAAYIEKDGVNYFIRGIGLANGQADLEQTLVKVNQGTPVLVRDVAQIELGSAIRYGALTQGKSEAVGGIVFMLKGENSRNVVINIKEKLAAVEAALPKGLMLEAYLDRELLIDRTIATVSKNLLEGGLIVVFVLVLLLGHLRAGLVVASVIPLSMLFAVGCMVAFKVSGNLMSLGAIDFGLIVDGAVIIVENVIRMLALPRNQLSRTQVIGQAAGSMANSSFFGQIIILIVYLPLLLLSGIEGKMFQPMALTVIFALVGAVILSLTYVPALSVLVFKGEVQHHETYADRLMRRLTNVYQPVLRFALSNKKKVLAFSFLLLVTAAMMFSRMGGEFIPQLDEGDFVIEIRMLPGSSLNAMIHSAELAATDIQAHFPDEVISCTGKIGTAEVPMDPMSIEEMDMVLTMHPREAWKKVKTRADFESELQKVLDQVPGVFTSIQQPIAMRFNELMSGAKTDMIVQVLGPDLDVLADIGHDIMKKVTKIPGAADVSVAKAEGLPQMFVEYKRDALARYGLSIQEVNTALQTAIAGQKAGMIFEGNRRFDVVVKMKNNPDRPFEILSQLMINTPSGIQVPLSELADMGIKEGPIAVNRIDGERCVNVALNIRGRDIQSVVDDVQKIVTSQIKLPEGYRVTYGGQFENLQNAKARLQLVVPAALGLILLLLYFSLGSIMESLLIFSAIPFAAVGGVFALWLRDMPFSISAGVGFIALFGVAVLNGMVLIGYFQQLEKEGIQDVTERIKTGVMTRFRPVIMTAAVASLGFLPMAISAGAGAEVQKPLATVVIGGLLSATFLTLVMLPVLYAMFASKRRLKNIPMGVFVLILGGLGLTNTLPAQTVLTENQFVEAVLQQHPGLKKAAYVVQEKTVLNQGKMPLPALQAYTWLPFNPEIGVIQNFNNPTLVKADRQVRATHLALAQSEQQITELALRREALLAFNHCLFNREKMRLSKDQDSLLQEYLRIAQLEYETGNINALAKLNIESKSREASRQAQQAQSDYRAAQLQLCWLAGLPDTAILLEDVWGTRPPSPTMTSLISLWGEQRQRLAQQELTKMEKQLLPSIGAGIVTNVDPKNRFLPNAYVSINLPLFKKGYKNDIEAAKTHIQIAVEEAALLRHNSHLRKQQAENQWISAQIDLNYWKDTGAALADLLIKTADIGRKTGDIGAQEYLQAITQVFLLRNNQLDAIRRWNESVIQLQFVDIP